MKKCFNNVQIFKSSEDCDKYSKSVSYETLVGGTTIICTDIKQNQRLSEGSADKPLSAVGTLTSLLCNSAKVVEKILQTSHVLRLVKVLGLVAVLSVGTISELQAESWNCGPEQNGKYSDSVICTYDESTKTLTISGEGKMGNYSYRAPSSSTAPWAHKEIVHAVIQGNVTSIGKRIFEGIRSLEDISGTENITSIGEASFAWTALSSANFPKASYIERSAFYGAENLEYINLAENVTFGPAKDNNFTGTKIPDCKGGTCERCSLIGQVKWEGECYDEYPFAKKRWTPAEANKWLHDGNDNFVIITFKK